jgi:hypothetical protein
MKRPFLITSCVLLLSAPAFAQNEQAGAGSGSGSGAGSEATSQTKATTTTTTKSEESNSRYPWVRALTNVQIELTLTDQTGSVPAEKKTVSMVVASGSWGKIRSAGTVRPPAEAPYILELNVDARPFVSIDGPIQLELTMSYSPPAGSEKENARTQARSASINQSQTVILQSGKPLIVSQAADPLGDRKVIIEIKATVIK